jgi:hypothetical protein
MSVTRMGVFLVLFTLSFSWTDPSVFGLFATLAWSLVGASIVVRIVGSGLVLTAALTSALLLAYSQGLGEAIVSGVAIGGYHASPEGVQLAVVSLIAHLALMGFVAWLCRKGLGQPNATQRANSGPQRATELAVVIFLGLSFFSALGSGSLTFWGATPNPATPETGAIRLELFYGPTLLVAVAYGSFRRLDSPDVKLPVWHMVALGIIVLLLFVLQSRRLMVAAGLIVALTQVVMTRSEMLLRLVVRLGAVAVVVVGLALASAGWRDVEAWETVGMAGRFERAADAVVDTRGVGMIEARLTYLWFDATAYDMRQAGAEVDGLGLLVSEIARASPRLLLPSKNDIPVVTCETALDDFGLPEDLPCTPTGEGMLWAGWLGLIGASILLGATLGLAETLAARGPGLARVFGLFLIFPAVMLESGLFAIVPALRLGLIGTGFIGLIMTLVRLLELSRPSKPNPR